MNCSKDYEMHEWYYYFCQITGMQSGVLVGAAPYALPLKHKILPQFLNDLGYKSIGVGKWHLGNKDSGISKSYQH